MESNFQQQKLKKEAQANPNIQTITQNDGQKTGICPNCHAELPEEALFCSECGLSIKQRVCQKCGAPDCVKTKQHSQIFIDKNFQIH